MGNGSNITILNDNVHRSTVEQIMQVQTIIETPGSCIILPPYLDLYTFVFWKSAKWKTLTLQAKLYSDLLDWSLHSVPQIE